MKIRVATWGPLMSPADRQRTMQQGLLQGLQLGPHRALSLTPQGSPPVHARSATRHALSTAPNALGS